MKIISKRAQPFDRVVGTRMRTFRNQRGMSQAELAGKLGVSFQQIQKNETGTNRLSFHRAVQASEALGISVVELGGLDGASAMPAKGLARIDFELMEEFSGLDPKVKPDALAILRHMKKAQIKGKKRK